jgi:type II secretory pathway component PulJ
MMNKKALTLLEIIVSVIILALVVTGLANVFVAGKRYIQHSKMRMSGGEIGKNFIDPLQNDVNQGTWSATSTTNRLSNPSAAADITRSIDGKDYTADYTVTNNSPGDNLNKVKVKITWPEEE